MPNENEYVDLSQMQNVSEVVGEIESGDYVPAARLIPPGRYISASRKITATVKPDGNITFQIDFPPEVGISSATDGRTWRYPPRTWISTRKFERKGSPGKTSQVAEYLKSCGYDPKKIDASSLILTIQESATVPVGVKIDWEDDAKERATVWKDGKQVPGPTQAYTRDFRQADGTFLPYTEKDGARLNARHRVGGFYRFKS